MKLIEIIAVSTELSIPVSDMSGDPTVKCDLCSDGGLFSFEINGKSAARRCECRRESDLAFGIPPRYASARPSDFLVDRVEPIVAWLENPARAGGGILLTGKPGRGKTHFGCALVRLFREKGKSASFLEAEYFFELCRDRYTNDTRESERDILRRYLEPQLLLVDDIGAGNLSDLERRSMLALLNRRGNLLRPTIVTTNWSLAQLATLYDERLASRLGEYWHISFDNLPDRRQMR